MVNLRSAMELNGPTEYNISMNLFAGMKLDSIEPNLIDLVWHDQPIRKFNPILALDTSYSGRSISDKVAQIRREMKGNKCTSVVITALDDVACEFTTSKLLRPFRS